MTKRDPIYFLLLSLLFAFGIPAILAVLYLAWRDFLLLILGKI